MAKINSKNKGNTMERKVAKMLSEWSGYQFNRTPASGGLHWKDDNSVTGDIVPPPELQFPLSIEVKKQEVPWDFDFILTGTSSLWEFYKQSARDAHRTTDNGQYKQPIVVFSKNRRGTYVMMPVEVFYKLPQLEGERHLVIRYSDRCQAVVMDFEKMLSLVSLQEILDQIVPD